MEAHDVTLRPGGVYQLEVGGLGSAGYAWSYDVPGPSGIVSVALEPLPAPPPPPPGGPPPDSYSVRYALVVTALKEGNTTVHLALRRPWEKEKPPVREIELYVTVAAGSSP